MSGRSTRLRGVGFAAGRPASRILALLTLLAAAPGSAQTSPTLEVVPRDPSAAPTLTQTTREAAERAGGGSGAIIRALDRTAGQTTDIDLAVDAAVLFGRIAIRLLECRYPLDNPASDAFARLQIVDMEGRSLFEGWMVASSPALSAMDHPRYDVWVLTCRT